MKKCAWAVAAAVLAAPAGAWADRGIGITDGKPFLPAWETDFEKMSLLHKDTEGQLNAFRAAHPEIYGVTDPPVTPVTFYAEYDPVDAIYLAWEAGYFDTFYYQFVHEIIARTTVQIFHLHHGAAERTAIEGYLTSRGEDPSEITFIDLATAGTYYVWETEWPFDRSLESFWTVDYGPYFVEDGTGVISILDPRYLVWRVNDDAVPTKLAAMLGVNAFRPDLDWDGGNLFSDGQGTCFGTGLHFAENLPRTGDEIEAQLESYFGCEKMIWLEPMIGDGTGHVDMFFKNAPGDVVIVGDFDPAMDAYNAAILDRNAALLGSETNAAGAPLTVIRVPMPSNADGVFRSYTNGIVVNDLVLVPVYSLHADDEAEALSVFEVAFPGRTVVPVDSEDIIEWGGAIHCVTRTRPVGTLAAMEDPPSDACSGAYDCVPGCGDVDFVGECVWGLPIYCDAGSIWVEMCWPGERCGWDLVENYFYCVGAGCGTLPPEGECRLVEGDAFAVTCEDGYPTAERCPDGTECVVLHATGEVGCRTPCTDDCTEGGTGCDPDGNPWICHEAGDGDDCLEVMAGSCDEEEECVDGSCVCLDMCAEGEAGCTPEGEAWACGEGDTDPCLEPVATPCDPGTHCDLGACVEDEDEGGPEPSGCGCSVVS